MKENMKDTKRVDAKNVDRKVGEAFKSYVLKKHGKLRGSYSEEVTNALKEYLQKNEEHTQKKVSGKSKEKKLNIGEQRYLKVEEALRAAGIFDKEYLNDIDIVDIKILIRDIVGFDQRTIDKYYYVFCQRHDMVICPRGEGVALKLRK